MTNRKFAYLIAALLNFIIIPALAQSDEFRLVPSITAAENYNSNIFVSSDNRESDFLTILSPAFELVNLTEQSDAKVKIRLDHINYAGNRELDSTDQFYHGKFRYNITPRFGFSADAGFISDSRPDRDLETTGLVSSALRRERINAAFSTDYQMTEQTALLLYYAYGKETFEKEFSDTLTHEVNAGFTRDLGQYVPALKGYTNLGYSYFDFSDTQMNIIKVSMGVSQDFSELWNARIDAGMSHTQSDFSALRPEQVTPGIFQIVTDEHTDDKWGWVGIASLNYRGEQCKGELSYIRDIRPSSGYSGAAVRNALTISTQYRMTYELSASLGAGYFTNKSDQLKFSTDTINTNSYYINPRIRYEVSKDIFVEASYNYNISNDKTEDTEAKRHLLSFRVHIQHPFLE